MVYCWSKQRQAWTRARRVNRCGGALTAPSRPTGTWRRDASPRSCSHRLSRVTGQHHLGERVGVPRNSPTASFRVQGSAEAAATRPTRAKWEAKTRRGARALAGSSDLVHLRQEESARGVTDLRVSPRVPPTRAEIPPSGEAGAAGDARRGHVIRRIIGQNFVAARIYVVYVCVCVCTWEREREMWFVPFPSLFSTFDRWVPRNLVTWTWRLHAVTDFGWKRVFFFSMDSTISRLE